MNWLDAAISFVSPEWGARRVAWRNELRNYDAGNDARLNAGWRVANYSAEATDRGNREYVRARARDLERNSDVMNSVLGQQGTGTIVENLVQGQKLRCDRTAEPEPDSANGRREKESGRRNPVREEIHTRRNPAVFTSDARSG